MIYMEKPTISKEKINPLLMAAVKMLGKTNDIIGDEIGKSAMIFTQIKNQRNLVGFETVALMRKRYKLNVNAIIDGDEQHLFDEYNFDSLLAKLDEEKKMNIELKEKIKGIEEERDFFKKIAMQK